MKNNKSWFANLLAENSKIRTGKNVLKEAKAAVINEDLIKIDELTVEINDAIIEAVAANNDEKIEYWNGIKAKFYNIVKDY